MIKKLYLALFVCLALDHAHAAAPITAKIDWIYQNVPGPMKIYEPSASKPVKLWETNSGKTLEALPVAKEIGDSTVSVYPGGKKQFVLVLKNESDKPLYFFAAPHQMSPAQHSLGFKFKCLCVNHVFKVPSGEYWYRVVELNLAPSAAAGAVTITHELILADEKIMQEVNQASHRGMDHEM